MGLVVTMSGAKKKSKGVSMPLDAFLSTEDSWADVEDDYTPAEEAPRDNYDNRGPPSPRGGDDMPPRGGRGDRYANRYESAPSRDARPQLPVPDRAPFIAFVGNLSFSATDDDIGHFFAVHCAVYSVRLIRDPSTGRSKGFGYVTFADRESLVTALGPTMLRSAVAPFMWMWLKVVKAKIVVVLLRLIQSINGNAERLFLPTSAPCALPEMALVLLAANVEDVVSVLVAPTVTSRNEESASP